MSKTIDIYGAKGGVGTSTVAAALAINLGGTLVSPVAAIMAGAFGDATTATFGDGPTVRDCGVISADNAPTYGDDAVLVIAPCYLALRHALSSNLEGFRGMVVITDTTRSLTGTDVAEILGDLDVLATIPRDPAIARAVDAGILNYRLPLTLAVSISDLEPKVSV